MKTTINWNIGLPQESGEYTVVINCLYGKYPYIWKLDYSAKNKMWNTHDWNTEEDASRFGILPSEVLGWSKDGLSDELRKTFGIED